MTGDDLDTVWRASFRASKLVVVGLGLEVARDRIQAAGRAADDSYGQLSRYTGARLNPLLRKGERVSRGTLKIRQAPGSVRRQLRGSRLLLERSRGCPSSAQAGGCRYGR
jgi:hypothetical protein